MIDMTMTATCRPDFVENTLRSFKEKLFTNLPLRTLFLNIDPIWGDSEDGNQVEKVARSLFLRVVVRRPETPSHGGAIKWLWAQPHTDWFLHIADDWHLIRPIDPHRLFRDGQRNGVVQVRLVRSYRPPYLTTSASLVRSEFGRMTASLLNPDMDPEAQFRNDINPTLQRAAMRCRAAYHGGFFMPQLASNLSKKWLDLIRH